MTPEQNIHGHAFNAVTGVLSGEDWVPLSLRSRVADAVVAAVEPVILAYERARFCEAAHDFPAPFAGIIATVASGQPAATAVPEAAGSRAAAMTGYERLFALQQQAGIAFDRHISTGGGYPGTPHFGMVAASYPKGSLIAREDSWRCHHGHPDDMAALECALSEVRRLAEGGTYEPCTAGPDCKDEFCHRDWERLER
jgi:hypothetical protein